LWIAGTSKGKCNLYMRKNINKGNEFYIEDALKNVNNMEYYHIDTYKVEELWETGNLHQWKKK